MNLDTGCHFFTVGLCASEKRQLIGLDLTEHGEGLR